jgi:hypothetical protein
MRCCICACELEGYGNNPDGAVWKTEDGEIVEAEFGADDRCCDMCDQMYVIPGRIYRLQKARQEGK